MHERDLSTTRLMHAARTPSSSAAGPPTRCSTATTPAPSSASATPSRWASSRQSPTAGASPARDVAVVGFDDSLAAQVIPPGLTSVRQPLEEVAVQIVRLLEDRLAMRSSEHAHVILTPELRLRGTT